MPKRVRRKLGSRQYKNYTEEMLQLATDYVQKNEMTSAVASQHFNIPRRTIENKVKKLHLNLPGGQVRFTDAEEAQMVQVLIAAGDFGSPLTELDLRLTVFEYLKKNSKESLFNNKPPGKWWVKNFLYRHKNELTTRSTQNIKRARAEKTADEYLGYFENLHETLKDVPKRCILNYDETNLSDNPGAVKAIFKRKVKYPERIINQTKGSISIMFAACGDGTLLPPYTVYKADHLWQTWCENGPCKARYNRTKSGWFDAFVFEDWFKTIVIPWAEKEAGPKVMIGDNLSSHLNIEILELCLKHQIRFAFLPPNSTHVTQPLDVGFFAPLKKHWRRILTQYKIENPAESTMNKSHFPALLTKLMDAININKTDIIKSAFKATGIIPYNPYKVINKLPDYDENEKYSIDSALLTYLKENRAPKPIRKTKNKKINALPGASISSEEIAQLKEIKTEKENKNQKTNKKRTKKNIKLVPQTGIKERRQEITQQLLPLGSNELFQEDTQEAHQFETKEIPKEEPKNILEVKIIENPLKKTTQLVNTKETLQKKSKETNHKNTKETSQEQIEETRPVETKEIYKEDIKTLFTENTQEAHQFQTKEIPKEEPKNILEVKIIENPLKKTTQLVNTKETLQKKSKETNHENTKETSQEQIEETRPVETKEIYKEDIKTLFTENTQETHQFETKEIPKEETENKHEVKIIENPLKKTTQLVDTKGTLQKKSKETNHENTKETSQETRPIETKEIDKEDIKTTFTEDTQEIAPVQTSESLPNAPQIDVKHLSVLHKEVQIDTKDTLKMTNTKKRKICVLSSESLSPSKSKKLKVSKSGFSRIGRDFDVFERKPSQTDMHKDTNPRLNPVPSTSGTNVEKSPLKLKNNKAISVNSSDESDFSLHDSSEGEWFNDSDSSAKSQPDNTTETSYTVTCPSNCVNEKFILVKFTSKKTVKYFVGQIVETCENGYLTKFMRYKKENIFYWPTVEDKSLVYNCDIEKILNNPQELRRGMLRFRDINIQKYNVR